MEGQSEKQVKSGKEEEPWGTNAHDQKQEGPKRVQ
jgi:hypothetical protein